MPAVARATAALPAAADAFVNDLERPIATYLYGRRMYETMVFWETVSAGADGVRDRPQTKTKKPRRVSVSTVTLSYLAEHRTRVTAAMTVNAVAARRSRRRRASMAARYPFRLASDLRNG